MSGANKPQGGLLPFQVLNVTSFWGGSRGNSARTPKWPDTLELLWEELSHLDLYLRCREGVGTCLSNSLLCCM